LFAWWHEGQIFWVSEFHSFLSHWSFLFYSIFLNKFDWIIKFLDIYYLDNLLFKFTKQDLDLFV
jgi:hypothetical protein